MIFEFCLVLLATYVLIHYFKPRGNLPPGPRGFPFLGSFPVIGLKEIVELKKKYGNIFMRRTGAINFLFICDYKLSKEALSKVEFASKYEWKNTDWDRKGVKTSNGIHWLHSRRFLLRHLRDLGMGKSKLEGLIMREAEELVEDFKKLTKEPSVIPFSLNIAILNILWQLIASHRYSFNDKFVEEFFYSFIGVRRSFGCLRLADFYPILEYIIPGPFLHSLIGTKSIQKMKEGFEDIIQPFIDDHLKTLDPNHPRDFIDGYLIEMEKQKNSEKFSHFSNSDLMRASFDTFVAGTGATANTLRWVLVYMARFQEIQEKIHLEIDRVVSRDRLPGLQHRNELAFLDATITEVQRHSTILVGYFRCAETNVELDGYHIPKGTVVLSLSGMSHSDPTYFKDPDKFDPSRFLDENGKFFPTCDGFQAFGVGKRQCIGENFARMELFLFTAALLQNFSFGPPDNEAEMKFEADEVLFTRRPLMKQKFSIKIRNENNNIPIIN